jgi:hypothetical protein
MKVEGDEDDDESTVNEGSETADAKRSARNARERSDPAANSAGASDSTRRPTAPPVPPGITVSVISWQQSLKQELEQCSKLGFFQRPTCLQNARNKYCAPSDAWGKTADCPARQNEQLTGN